jgi:hypothetical protein
MRRTLARVDDDSPTWEGIEQVEAQYANSFRVGYNAFEILLDFGKLSGEGGKAKIQSRIITTPALAQALLTTLQESLQEYQSGFGEISREGV